MVDDEAERRARNLQRKQAQTTHFDSPQVASEKASRRSIGGISGKRFFVWFVYSLRKSSKIDSENLPTTRNQNKVLF